MKLTVAFSAAALTASILALNPANAGQICSGTGAKRMCTTTFTTTRQPTFATGKTTVISGAVKPGAAISASQLKSSAGIVSCGGGNFGRR
jgi:hypothetical protein